MSQNIPNPFRDVTEFGFYLPQRTNVELTILNMMGEIIEVLISDELDKGKYSLTYNVKYLSDGTYFYRLQSDNFTETKKMVIISH